MVLENLRLLRRDAAVSELKSVDDLSPYRDWFIKLIKYTDKLQSTVDSDFI